MDRTTKIVATRQGLLDQKCFFFVVCPQKKTVAFTEESMYFSTIPRAYSYQAGKRDCKQPGEGRAMIKSQSFRSVTLMRSRHTHEAGGTRGHLRSGGGGGVLIQQGLYIANQTSQRIRVSAEFLNQSVDVLPARRSGRRDLILGHPMSRQVLSRCNRSIRIKQHRSEEHTS